jgi:Spy/CpxP family protein refolding chaperone
MMVTARRARLTGMIMLALAFMVGSLTGAAALRVAEADGAPKLMRTKARQQPPPDLLERLELTAEQRAQVDVILERRRQEMESFWDVHRPTLQAIADSARAELRSVLTPEQQEIEEQFIAERRAHHERRERARNDRW